MRARAAVLRDSPGTLRVEQIDLAEPQGHEVLVHTTAVGLCHSDLNIIDGVHPRPTPLVIGHEMAGEIVQVGSDVHDLSVGSSVVASLAGSCGSCAACSRGERTLCDRTDLARRPGEPPRARLGEVPLNAAFGIGAMSELVVLDRRHVVPVPEQIPPAHAALLGCAVVTGVGAVHNTAQVTPGETVAVVGCGGVGLNAVQGARIAGASTIIAVDADETALPLALALGATHALTPADVASGAVERISPGGVDHAFEAAGLPVTAQAAFDLTRTGGTTTVMGMLAEDSQLVLPGWALLRRKIQGSVMGSTTIARDVPLLAAMVLDGRLNLHDQVTLELSLDDVAEGFDRLRGGVVGRQVVTFS